MTTAHVTSLAAHTGATTSVLHTGAITAVTAFTNITAVTTVTDSCAVLTDAAASMGWVCKRGRGEVWLWASRSWRLISFLRPSSVQPRAYTMMPARAKSFRLSMYPPSTTFLYRPNRPWATLSPELNSSSNAEKDTAAAAAKGGEVKEDARGAAALPLREVGSVEVPVVRVREGWSLCQQGLPGWCSKLDVPSPLALLEVGVLPSLLCSACVQCVLYPREVGVWLSCVRLLRACARALGAGSGPSWMARGPDTVAPPDRPSILEEEEMWLEASSSREPAPARQVALSSFSCLWAPPRLEFTL